MRHTNKPPKQRTVDAVVHPDIYPGIYFKRLWYGPIPSRAIQRRIAN